MSFFQTSALGDRDPFVAEISRHIWHTKYRMCEEDGTLEGTIYESWCRIARAVAALEPSNCETWEKHFYEILKDFKFLPGGRIQAGAGTDRNVTLFNCFVMGTIEDSMEGIFQSLREGAITMQQGGGVGYDFSTLRPRGTPARGVGTIASGPVSFLAVWNAMCDTILSTGARRGAMMATLRCDHPDIEQFIAAKHAPSTLRHFNLSVLVTDEFVAAVRADDEWPLVFPIRADGSSPDAVRLNWPGYKNAVPCCVHRRIRARGLWDRILRATYDTAEPGVLFIDRINSLNNLWYRERIGATNPCGEIPLPPYGACDLGSLNLVQFVHQPFTKDARLEEQSLTAAAGIATRFLDNVVDASRFPLREHERIAKETRRIGLGITGLADALLMLGLDYGSKDATEKAADIMRCVCHGAYRTSVALAQEKGAFPAFDAARYLQGRFVQSLPKDIQADISKHGIRNSHLIAIAPTGTISLLANNVSSGLEPIFATSMKRRVLNADGSSSEFDLVDYAVRLWQREFDADGGLPPKFLCVADLSPRQHLAMQAALQPYVDNSISKTINVPKDYLFADFKQVYDLAYDLGLKGCTTFRPNPLRAAVIRTVEEGMSAPHCCAFEREAD